MPRALLSVSDKTGVADLARGLADRGFEIVSTGGTARALTEAGLAVTAVSDVTGFPEMLDGRVKTLHPALHGGILARRDRPDDLAAIARHGVGLVDIVVVNLYPFAKAAADPDTPFDALVEEIDIGGPSLVRAAAKNFRGVLVVVDPADYPRLLASLDGGPDLAFRYELMRKALAHTAAYDTAISATLAEIDLEDGRFVRRGATGPFAVRLDLSLRKLRDLRYGENPHQRAALYLGPARPPGIAGADQVHGKAMSYNNYVDAAAAWRVAFEFTEPCVAIIKHSNPCGIAVGADLADAHRKAHACDPVSAYGGVIAANGPVTAALAAQIAEIFTEVVVAPGFEPAAKELLTAKKSLRLLSCPPPERAAAAPIEWRQLDGGLLMQSADLLDAPGDDPATWELKAGPVASGEVMADLIFAWRACRSVKSNAILIATGGATVGVGMGQVNRVDSARLAVTRSGERARGAVAASDAFFPFPDGLRVLAGAGVSAIVEPGGSVRDDEVVQAAADAGVSLYFTGARHFFH
jgi:phosphoribosylaminoimidazolecarboxamide formyltransferase / IMP cyclohydrolase